MILIKKSKIAVTRYRSKPTDHTRVKSHQDNLIRYLSPSLSNPSSCNAKCRYFILFKYSACKYLERNKVSMSDDKNERNKQSCRKIRRPVGQTGIRKETTWFGTYPGNDLSPVRLAVRSVIEDEECNRVCIRFCESRQSSTRSSTVLSFLFFFFFETTSKTAEAEQRA